MTALADILSADAKLAEEARTRAEKATPGPWLQDDRSICAKAFDGSQKYIVERVRGGSPGQAEANARFIAAARTDVPALASRLTAYREALEIATIHLGRRIHSPGFPREHPSHDPASCAHCEMEAALAEIAAKLGAK